MTPMTLTPEAGASAPAPPADTPALVATEDALFPKRSRKRQEVTLPDARIRVLIEELTPKEYDEVNHAAVKTEGGDATLDNRQWNARLIALALRKPDGGRWYKNGLDKGEWRALSVRIWSEWSIPDVQHVATAVADLSGISKKAREEAIARAGKDSSGTATAS